MDENKLTQPTSSPAELEAVAEGLETLYPDLADEFRYYAGLPVGNEWDEGEWT